MEFVTEIERRASRAPSLDAFNKLSLHAIKKSVAQLLETIGREGIFREYTRHDISHVDKLLEVCDWLVPPVTLSSMTVADCLMTSLAVFHDLGMVVTRDEFERRNESGFPNFRRDAFAGNAGRDYEEKILRMPLEQAEKFLYQEFVRQNHAHRIRSWVMGKNARSLGVADQVLSEVNHVLEGLGDKFRKDLGLVCESHHMEDLDDLEKYRTSQPYGSNPQEYANLQYCAILLRTADVLHVTKDRAPSLSFRIINPSDPKSIEEWHKQMAVVAVRSKQGLDKDGNVDPAAPRDTVEVHGYFTEPEGFFALTAYLLYARRELVRSSDWAHLAKKRKGVPHDFPWRDIDDSGLEAEGFINKQFEFTLDQARILDLLTGHTLYNDTSVVLRELVQNCLDAIRVQWETETGYIDAGEVAITWNSVDRTLTVEDNGTGMTQRIIDDHFLKVGSSFYQNEQFRKDHPHFSAISRFGIGVLSTFMISDEIEVTTCHPDDAQARRLSLRSLHGKYLVRLLDKEASGLPKRILPHGTQIRLKVRPSAELKDLTQVLKSWIMFPRCKVTAALDGAAPVVIGFIEPKEALRELLTARGLLRGVDSGSASPPNGTIRIEQRTKGGVTIAYALEWSSYFKEWTFLSGEEPPFYSHRKSVRDAASSLVATCVEGIRVSLGTPGYQGFGLFAIANAVGANAPKTNVARSALEETSERKALVRNVYDLYCEHVKAEVQELQRSRSFSLSWAVEEASWLLDPLFGHNTPLDAEALTGASADVPCIALEERNSRIAVSPRQLSERSSFWTVDGAFFSSAEALLKEVPTSVAMSRLVETIGTELLQMPIDPYISGQVRRRMVQRLVFGKREVDRIVVHPAQRRVDLRWSNVSEMPVWVRAIWEDSEADRILEQLVEEHRRYPRTYSNVVVAQREIEVKGLGEEVAIKSGGRTFVLPDTDYARYLLALIGRLEASANPSLVAHYVIAIEALEEQRPIANASEFVQQRLVRMPMHVGAQTDGELAAVLQKTKFVVFDPSAWARDGE